MKNKRSQVLLVGMMIAFVVFVAAIVFIQPIKDMLTFARNSDNLDCSNNAISTGTKSVCLVTDFYLFSFIGFIMIGALGFITGKKLGVI